MRPDDDPTTARLAALYNYPNLSIRVPMALLTRVVVTTALAHLRDNSIEGLGPIMRLVGLKEHGRSSVGDTARRLDMAGNLTHSLSQLQEWLLASGGDGLQAWLDEQEKGE